MRLHSARFALILSTVLTLGLPASLCLAETVPFKISGMTCQACVKSVKAQVCSLKSVKKCEVEVGKVVLTSKDGQTIDPQEVAKAVKAASKDFDIIKP
ncbi:MAG: heavy-metal-associated domain-containing protein [Bdellovibrionales bacterium]|jgi:copper chaperone CopZ|nr:heavy-metal-associated domain-containing protein [Bdellovibrionales bacterium]